MATERWERVLQVHERIRMEQFADIMWQTGPRRLAVHEAIAEARATFEDFQLRRIQREIARYNAGLLTAFELMASTFDDHA